MRSLVIHAWPIIKSNKKYYLPYTHFAYLKEIILYYEKIVLLSPTKVDSINDNNAYHCISDYEVIDVYELPNSRGYVNAIRFFAYYVRAYRALKNNSTFYARYPVPFGWLQKIYAKNARRIIHYVGDPVDVTLKTPSHTLVKKFLLIVFFQPEHFMYAWACKGAEVYTNGFSLANKLKRLGVGARPLISTTLEQSDFFIDRDKIIKPATLRLIYVGYLRKAKGVDIVMRAFSLIKEEYPAAELTIVGTGDSEYMEELRLLSIDLNLSELNFLGHIDDRSLLNKVLREHDIFCFASLSEGSPRVILEAMANGLNVISTPVGSLPHVFENNVDIQYTGFNNAKDLLEGVIKIVNNSKLAQSIRINAFNKVKEFSVKSFIKEIFDEA
jgi:glycosyltransferase involved in cell wall biosynthesis